MKKRYYDYDTLVGAMHDVVLENGAKHRCIDAGMILDLPQADVIEQKRGEWIDRAYYCVCNQCGHTEPQFNGVQPIPRHTPFCASCGADMREEETE